MLFRKRMEKSCTYCSFGTKLDDDRVQCTKKGVVPVTGKCWRFQYDPLKRVPSKPKALDFEKYNDEDFSL